MVICCFFFQAEDGIRDLVRSRGLGDVYKRQVVDRCQCVHQGIDVSVCEVAGEVFPDLARRKGQHLSLIHI